MTKYSVWYTGTDWEQSSEQPCHVKVQEPHIWPIADNSVSGVKDALANGDHPVVAIGGRTAADGRPQNLTGVVLSYDASATQAVIDVCPSRIVRAYVSNILTYAQGAPATWEAAPALGQPIYVDDSDDLGAGTTLSMASANTAGVDNPLAGYLFYCQDEYVDSGVGGPNSSATFPLSWTADADAEYLVCVLLTNATP
jgi:hypothetical protein